MAQCLSVLHNNINVFSIMRCYLCRLLLLEGNASFQPVGLGCSVPENWGSLVTVWMCSYSNSSPQMWEMKGAVPLSSLPSGQGILPRIAKATLSYLFRGMLTQSFSPEGVPGLWEMCSCQTIMQQWIVPVGLQTRPAPTSFGMHMMIHRHPVRQKKGLEWGHLQSR